VYIVVDPKPFLKFGYFGIFIFNSVGGLGTYLIPTLSQQFNLVLLSLSTALGMAINDSISWVVGKGSTAIIQRGKWTNHVEVILNKYGSVALFFISALPVPYDAVGLISGYLGIKYRNFFLPTFAGKFIRMILIGLGTAQLIKLF
jgi:membrane protein YqaA with SNARE-associated domain